MATKQCRHIFTNGEQCNGPRMREHNFCYFHHRFHSQHRAALQARPDRPILNTEGQIIGHGRPIGFEGAALPDLGPLENRAAVQLAISTVVNALATQAIDARRATALLYGLQLAAAVCPPKEEKICRPREYAVTITESPEGIPIATDDEHPGD
jgi:hypothetical protein